MRFGWSVVWVLSGAVCAAQELQINETPFADLKALKPTVDTFQTYPQASIRDELRTRDARVGQLLAGQSLQSRTGRGLDTHWVLKDRTAEVPLLLATGSEGPVAGVIRDAAFGGTLWPGSGRSRPGWGAIGWGRGW